MHNPIANRRGAIGSHRTDVRILALRGAAIAVCILGIFALLKMVLYPNITIWASHLVTILVAALLVSIRQLLGS